MPRLSHRALLPPHHVVSRNGKMLPPGRMAPHACPAVAWALHMARRRLPARSSCRPGKFCAVARPACPVLSVEVSKFPIAPCRGEHYPTTASVAASSPTWGPLCGLRGPWLLLCHPWPLSGGRRRRRARPARRCPASGRTVPARARDDCASAGAGRAPGRPPRLSPFPAHAAPPSSSPRRVCNFIICLVCVYTKSPDIPNLPIRNSPAGLWMHADLAGTASRLPRARGLRAGVAGRGGGRGPRGGRRAGLARGGLVAGPGGRDEIGRSKREGASQKHRHKWRNVIRKFRRSTIENLAGARLGKFREGERQERREGGRGRREMGARGEKERVKRGRELEREWSESARTHIIGKKGGGKET